MKNGKSGETSCGNFINSFNSTRMKRWTIFLLLILIFIIGSCSTSFKSKLPTNYTDLSHKVDKRIKNNPNLDKSLCEGQLMMLQLGMLYPTDTVSLYINDELVFNKITTDFPYPYIDKEEYGGHGAHYYDFLLVRQKNRDIVSVINLRDPQKETLAKVLIKDTFDICIVDEKERAKSIKIPKDIDHFIEIQFVKTSFVDTLSGIRYFD